MLLVLAWNWKAKRRSAWLAAKQCQLAGKKDKE
jgi:hypothetical protein